MAVFCQSRESVVYPMNFSAVINHSKHTSLSIVIVVRCYFFTRLKLNFVLKFVTCLLLILKTISSTAAMDTIGTEELNYFSDMAAQGGELRKTNADLDLKIDNT